MEDRNLGGKRQELASKLVQREVVQRVSFLMSGIMEISQQVPYRVFGSAFGTNPDDLVDLFRQQDWEEPATQFIQVADLEQLESIADEHGFWCDIVDQHMPKLFESEPDEDGDTQWGYGDEGAEYGDEDDAREAALESVIDKLRDAVQALVDSAGAWQEVCQEWSLDPEDNEVYEHWVVSDWLASRLREKGETVAEFADLTVWGRCTTGQSISMDWVIQEITRELWPEEWAGKETA